MGTAVRPPSDADGEAGGTPCPQWLMPTLPKAGFRAPITLTVLPTAFTGMWIGAWMTLPETTPGEPTALPSAWAEWAEARPVPAASRPPATIVTAAAFFRFFTSKSSLRSLRQVRSTHWRTSRIHRGCAVRGTYTRRYED